ncbi:MAG: DUF2238 domain-containing protein [Bacteroidales bacterium]|nr:DUF2238 domain-containing protein [Bacteroidales bacterium]
MKKWIFIALILFAILCCLKPEYPQLQLLQQAGTILLLIPLAVDLHKKAMPMSAYAGIACFTVLHIVGARYIYSYVPYREWADSLGLHWDFLDSQRNCYDRLVHLGYGIFFFPYFVYLSRKWFCSKKWASLLIAWCIIQTGSLLYELFEWTLSIVMAPEDAENYNGQQGDIYDAQKDMALALLGSSAMFALYSIRNLIRKHV